MTRSRQPRHPQLAAAVAAAVAALGVVLAVPPAATHAEPVPAAPGAATEATPPPAAAEKRVLGPTATVDEVLSGLRLTARVDTGAASCSMHVDEVVVEDGHENMRKNLRKPARLRVTIDDEDHWIDTEIADTVLIKNPNSPKKQRRYLVWLTLRAAGLEKRVLVSLSDRSHLKYPLLLGRNFLHGDFLVDVALDAQD